MPRFNALNFRVMTYNIHKGIGVVDRKYSPNRIIETIEHHDPDVVLLQEVDEDVPRSRRDSQVELLGDALASALAFAWAAFKPPSSRARWPRPLLPEDPRSAVLASLLPRSPLFPPPLPLPFPFPPRSAKAGAADIVKTAAVAMESVSATHAVLTIARVLEIISLLPLSSVCVCDSCLFVFQTE